MQRLEVSMNQKDAGGKPAQAGPIGCTVKSCKSKEARFGFCHEHFDHYKFGLIKKTGEKVSDYEKKFEQYQSFLANKGASKKAA